MKSENLYDSITNIDNELIMKANRPAFIKKRKSPITIIVSAAAVFILVTAIGLAAAKGGFSSFITPPEATGEEINNTAAEDIPPIQTSPEAVPLAKAEYPKKAPYPYLNPSGVNGKPEQSAYDKWAEDRRNTNKITVETDNIKAFSNKIMSEYLTGKNNENKAVSPLNIYMAFSMLAETCGGNTRNQLLELLGVDSIDELRKQASKIWQKNYRDDGVMKSVMGNSIWLSDSMSYNESTVARIAKNYYGDVYSGKMGTEEYNSALNLWINEHTDGLIPTDIEMYPETVFAIASTLLFTSKWENEFNKKSTEEGIFHAPSDDITAEYMKATRQMYYYWGDNFSAIALPLNIGGYMWFILPDEGTDADMIFADNEAALLITSPEKGLMNYENRKFIKVNMAVPKFDITCQYELTDGFENLGISDITIPQKADFSPLLSDSALPVWLDKASHGVRVKIDEEGVTAAAYTVMMSAGSAAPPDEIVDFILDRPFAFAVTLDYTTVLFAGVVNTP